MDSAAMVRAYFAAYENWDRAAVESLLADDFTFKSPVDDIDRATYFERCWPAAKDDRKVDIRTLLTDGNEAMVRYECAWPSGEYHHRCAEYFRTDGRKITHIDVFFGFWPSGAS